METKTVWALDVFDDSPEIEGKCLELALALPYKIEPVYVLSPDQLNLALEFTPPWVEQYKPNAKKGLESKIDKLLAGKMNADERSKKFLPAQVITHPKPSLAGAVEALIEYSTNKNSPAEMILVGSHSRKGLGRMILGSFAETLVLKAKLPVMVVNSHGKISPNADTILHPSDLTTSSVPAFDQSLALAKKLGKKMILFHALTNPVEPVFQSGVYLLSGGWIPVPDYLEREEDRVVKFADPWLKKAREQGVEIKLEIDRNHTSITQAVLDYSSKPEIELVAMSAHSGPVATVLVGSITRQLLRDTQKPVWIYRS